jgi:hypothetical protein
MRALYYHLPRFGIFTIPPSIIRLEQWRLCLDTSDAPSHFLIFYAYSRSPFLWPRSFSSVWDADTRVSFCLERDL